MEIEQNQVFSGLSLDEQYLEMSSLLPLTENDNFFFPPIVEEITSPIPYVTPIATLPKRSTRSRKKKTESFK